MLSADRQTTLNLNALMIMKLKNPNENLTEGPAKESDQPILNCSSSA